MILHKQVHLEHITETSAVLFKEGVFERHDAGQGIVFKMVLCEE